MKTSDRRRSLWGGKTLWSSYNLIRVRGQGAFGQVWEAETPAGKKIALKFIPCGDNLSAGEEIRNIMRVKQLNHPLLVTIHEVRADQGYVVVAMELADGSLLDMLQVSRKDFSEPLQREYVCDYLTQAAQALDFLNAPTHDLDGTRAGIQHGDVKPGNLLVYGDVVKLCDFGLSRVTTADLVSHRRAGTLAYAAPEVFAGQISRWTDQYALAVTYAELRTGFLPFAKIPSRFGRACVKSEPDLSTLPTLERLIVARALARSPHDRWPTCSALLSELSKISDLPQGRSSVPPRLAQAPAS